MVILSLPSMSNSFLGHPDKNQFAAETGQATLIQIKNVRYRTLICRFEIRYAARSLLPHSRRYTAVRQATQQQGISRLRTKILFVSLKAVSPKFVSPRLCRGRRTPEAGLRLASERSRRGRFLISQHPQF
jgi:hypothetical protein